LSSERDLCIRCLRAKSVCLCEKIRPFRSTFTTVLLQHPKERKNSIGTARLTHLCIENSILIPGTEFDENVRVQDLLKDPANACVILYPGKDATQLPEEKGKLIESLGDRTLVVFVIDGTWELAKGMLRRSPKLRSLPTICFTPETPSRYRVRKQPAKHCLSTIEAVHVLTQMLDPKPEADILIRLFSEMVEQQVAFGFDQDGEPKKKFRNKS
jgi:DTW domain-containing protein